MSAMPIDNPIDNDPRPMPPEMPGDDECCRSGCDPCIFDWYAQEMERYRADLQAWEARHAGGKAAAGA